MTDGLSETGRFRYLWKGDEYYIVDTITGREFHLGLIVNHQVAAELALNTCRVLEGLVSYDPTDIHSRGRLIIEMSGIFQALPCEGSCHQCVIHGQEESLGYWHLACYIKSRISILSGRAQPC